MYLQPERKVETDGSSSSSMEPLLQEEQSQEEDV